MDENKTVRLVNRTFVSALTVGATLLVAGQGASRFIRVLSVVVWVVGLAVNIKFQSGATDICPVIRLGQATGTVLPFNPHGWFQTNPGDALNVNLSAASQTSVLISWCLGQ